ncbi:hypothetical protein [Methylobacterium isbiliense]|uniref:TRAP transporter small permease n=1 Tax=Methylobacterium isbiliense TaxID=315478 RepID=A0ABQ4SLY7_9HYPH|nr:hypothetical protein [Methylobacterium isbiliense]MDN3623895.1 hypothetical protein [Methylobacterium isbiliense]GJE02748.1 hypothetical protein GMJLKIPL_4697 [Methylobacterium isbiliense]
MTSPSSRTEPPIASRTPPGGETAGQAAPTLRRRVLDEAERYLWFALYLIVVFGTLIIFSLNIYARFDQDVPHYPSYHFYALGLINALVFAKIMLIAEAAGVGSAVVARRAQERRVITSILYRASIFSAVLVVAYVLEKLLEGLWHGKGVGRILPEIAGGPLGLISLAWVLLVALIPYFTYRELGRILGDARLRAILLSRGGASHDRAVRQGEDAFAPEVDGRETGAVATAPLRRAGQTGSERAGV